MTFEKWLKENERRMHCGHFTHEECLRVAFYGGEKVGKAERKKRDIELAQMNLDHMEAERELQGRVWELEGVLARSGIILEALNMSVDWELADSIKQQIADACISIRQALQHAEGE